MIRNSPASWKTRLQAPMATSAARLNYFLYNEETPVQEGSPAWSKTLPVTRGQACHLRPSPPLTPAVTLGDYFQAAGAFLKKEGFSLLRSAVFQQTGKKAGNEDLQRVRVCLKKHGEFYHPAKITLVGTSFMESFVLNVAVSDAGKSILQQEVQCLKRLGPLHPVSWIPRVYGAGTVSTKAGSFAMFLGQWFEGYHEFHLSLNPSTNRIQVSVWDEDSGNCFLEDQAAETLYREIAYLLTTYYNPVTFEAIHPWHHAAGDFVIKGDADSVSVRLVTVRGYRERVETDAKDDRKAPSVETILHALLLFFLELSWRIRLDRESGTGCWMWAEAECVDPTVRGFFAALEEKKDCILKLPASLADCFKAYLHLMTEKDALDLLQAMTAQQARATKESAFLREHLDAHAWQWMSAVKRRIR